MLEKKMEDALNKQVNAELYSGYLYLSMAGYYHGQGLPGFAAWMESQAKEELFHAMKMYGYIVERGGRALMAPIEGPKTGWDNPARPFDDALAHEIKVTGMINGLVDLAREMKDHATDNFLQWFVAEQVEEEATAEDVVNKLKLIGGEGQGMLMMDKELGARVPIFAFPVTQ